MSSKNSLIMQLYKQAAGKQGQQDGTRLVTSTNTLINNTMQNVQGEKKTLPEDVPLETREYEATMNRVKNLLVLNTRNIFPGDQLRLVETKGLVPTGRSLTKTIKEVIVGTNENGVCAGKMIVALQDIMW